MYVSGLSILNTVPGIHFSLPSLSRAVSHRGVVFISAVAREPWFAGSVSAGLTLFGELSSETVQQE